MWRYGFILAVFFVLSCTKAPEIPSLPGENESALLLLDHNLDASDLRAIARHMNQNGQLSALAAFVDELSEQDVQSLAEFFGEFFYRDADLPKSAATLLKKRIQARDFSRFHQKMRQLSQQDGFRASQHALFQTLPHPSVRHLLSVNSSLLSRKSHEIFSQLNRSAAEFNRSSRLTERPALSTSHADWEIALSEIQRRNNFGPTLDRIFQQMEDDRGFSHLLAGFRQVGSEETGAAIVEATVGRLVEMASTEKSFGSDRTNELGALFQLFGVLNTDWVPIRDQLVRTLREQSDVTRELVSAVQVYLYPMIFQVCLNQIQAQLEKSPAFTKDDFIALGRTDPRHQAARLAAEAKLLPRIRDALRRIVSYDNILDHLVHSFVLMKWVQHFVEQNGRAVAELRTPVLTHLWQLSARTPEWTLSLVNFTPAGAVQLPYQADFQRLRLGRLNAQIRHRAESEIDDEFEFSFPAQNGPFHRQFRAAISAVDGLRPIADGSTLVRAILFRLLEEGRFGILGEQEFGNNLLSRFNQALSALSLRQRKQAFDLIFGELELGRLAGDDIDFIADQFSASSNNERRVRLLFENIELINRFRQKTARTPSPIEFYHRIIQQFPSREMLGMSQLIGFVGTQNLLSVSPRSHASSPVRAIYQSLLAHPKKLGGYLFALSNLSRDQTNWLETQLRRSLTESMESKSSFGHLWSLFQHLNENPHGRQFLVRALQGELPFNFSGEIQPEEQDYLERMLPSQSFLRVYRLLASRLNRQQSLQAISQLQSLAEQGVLSRSLSTLTHVQNDRLFALASALRDWVDRGEFVQCLGGFRILLEEG